MLSLIHASILKHTQFVYFITALLLWAAELGFPKMRYGKCT